MLQLIRDKYVGIVTWVIVIAISSTFILVGVRKTKDVDDNVVASVGKQQIFAQDLDFNYAEWLAAKQGSLTKQQFLHKMVESKALDLGLTKAGLFVPQQHLLNKIRSNSIFQVEGSFSVDRFKEVLAIARLSEAEYKDIAINQEFKEQLYMGFMQTYILTKQQRGMWEQLLLQARDFGYAVIPFAKLKPQITVSTNELESYYQEHKSEFNTQESIKFKYLSIEQEMLRDKIKVADNLLEEYYQQHEKQWLSPELWQVSHILIKKDKQAEAKDIATDIVAQLSAGADFMQLSSEYSQDNGVQQQKGELGWFAYNQQLPPEVFELQQGQHSEVIESEYGYHIYYVKDKRAESVREFAEVKDIIYSEVERGLLAEAYNNMLDSLYDALDSGASNIVDVAEQLGLPIYESEWVTAQQQHSVFAASDLKQFLFSQEATTNKSISDVYEIKDKKVVAQISDYRAPQTQAFAEVKNTIKSLLTEQQSKKLAEVKGQEMLTALQQGQPPHQTAKHYAVPWQVYKNVRRTSQAMSPEVLRLAFSLTKPQDKASLGVKQLSNGDYVVLMVSAEKQDDTDSAKEDVNKFITNIERQYAFLELQALEQELISKAQVKYHVPLLQGESK